MKKNCLLLCLLIPCFSQAQNLPWQKFELVGEADLKFLLWPVYQARLYSSSGNFEYSQTRSFALALEYKRQFSKQQLIEETKKQWQFIGIEQPTAWIQALDNVLRDVDKNDVITLFVDKPGSSIFYLNDQLLGSIDDPEFTRQFSAIWLSEKTSRPEFRADLLGSMK